MQGYGEYCSVARALELVGERWTLLVVRELLCGSRRFAELSRGIPRISRTMLSARLRTLEDAALVAREDDGYALTEAGRELWSVVSALGTWGQRWLPRELTKDELAIDALFVDLCRRVHREALPTEPVVVRFELTDLRGARARRYLLLRPEEVSLCGANAGFPERVVVHADRRTLIGWWRGDLSLAAARAAGMRIEGPLARELPRWLARYVFADVAPVRRGRRSISSRA